MQEYWMRCPLGVKIHYFLNALDDPQFQDNENDDAWHRVKGISNLDLFAKTINGANTGAALKSSLSYSQWRSWQVIEEWLQGEYQPLLLAGGARRAIESTDFLPSKWLYDHAAWVATGSPPNESYYQRFLFNLYFDEFVPSSLLFNHQAGDEELGLLESDRHRAFCHALCMQAAHQLHSHIDLGAPLVSFEGVGDPPMTREACPWLERHIAADEMPHYLWDTIEQKTITVSELDAKPTYCCISHTWGRWQAKGKPRVQVQGVPFWLIPQNTIFDVKELPEHLRLCAKKLQTRYIWFDLVCIPQFESGKEDSRPDWIVALGKREIARQAGIFRNAKQCAIWFNYVDDWSAEKATIDYLSLTYLDAATPSTHYNAKESLLKNRKRAEFPLQLTVHPTQKKFLGNTTSTWSAESAQTHGEAWDQPSAWFSSLWTLQEAYLRTDMILLNRAWEPLTNTAGIAYTLEKLSVIVQTLQGILKDNPAVFERRSQLPMGPAQLFNLIFGVQFVQNGYPSRAHILVQGNTRQCTGRRAEAIMSVLGVTDWFSQTSPDEDMVLGMYPLEFLNEAKAKIGPDFFLAQKRTGSPSVSRDFFSDGRRGSMLPFDQIDAIQNRGKDDVKMFPYQAYDQALHPTVASWTLDPSGSFIIKHAAVVASSEGRCKDVPELEVLLAYQKSPGEVAYENRISLEKWVQAQAADFRTFAVSISRELGLILQGFHSGESQPAKLIKVGCFQVFGLVDITVDEDIEDDWISTQPMDWAPAQDVDWLVL